MGCYIEVPDRFNKARQLIDRYRAEILSGPPPSFDDVPEDKALICVVSNQHFDAAAHCFDEHQFEIFTRLNDVRTKYWLLMNKELASKLSGFNSWLAGKV